MGTGRSLSCASRCSRSATKGERHGEAYAAVRWLTDLLPFLDTDLRASLAERAAARLAAMGAVTSAEEATASADPERTLICAKSRSPTQARRLSVGDATASPL
jgi:hypothetical protein